MSKKPTPKLPTHAKCPQCGEEVKLCSYVYAHWDIELCRTCEKCGCYHGLRLGRTYEL